MCIVVCVDPGLLLICPCAPPPRGEWFGDGRSLRSLFEGLIPYGFFRLQELSNLKTGRLLVRNSSTQPATLLFLGSLLLSLISIISPSLGFDWIHQSPSNGRPTTRRHS